MTKTFALGTTSTEVATRSFVTRETGQTSGTVIETFGSYATDDDLWKYNGGPYQSERSIDPDTRWTLDTNRYTTDGQSLTLQDWNEWDFIYSMPGDGLGTYIKQEDRWEYYFYTGIGPGSNDSIDNRHGWGVQKDYYHYKLECSPQDDAAGFVKHYGDGNITRIKHVDNIGFAAGNWYRVEIFWSGGNTSGYANGDHEFTIERVDSFDANGWASDTTHLVSFSANDSDYGDGGLGWGMSASTTDQNWDSLRLLNR